MRTKALMLGAAPVPFESRWVPIDESERWVCRSMTRPKNVDLNGAVAIEVLRVDDGEPILYTLEAPISGRFVRAILRQEVEGVESVSIFVVEVTE